MYILFSGGSKPWTKGWDQKLLVEVVIKTMSLTKNKEAQAPPLDLLLLVTKQEGHTGRISALDLDCTDRVQRDPWKIDRQQIFSQ